VVSPASAWRSSAGPVSRSALSWLIAWVRPFMALRRATRRVRIASTRPSRVFGMPAAVPESTAVAAA
jgi:hypothetical protein